jgi:hypothetical protein
VTEIGFLAFSGCSGLRHVVVPGGKTEYYSKHLPWELHSGNLASIQARLCREDPEI